MSHVEGGWSLVAANSHLHLYPRRRCSSWHRHHHIRRIWAVSGWKWLTQIFCKSVFNRYLLWGRRHEQVFVFLLYYKYYNKIFSFFFTKEILILFSAALRRTERTRLPYHGIIKEDFTLSFGAKAIISPMYDWMPLVPITKPTFLNPGRSQMSLENFTVRRPLWRYLRHRQSAEF